MKYPHRAADVLRQLAVAGCLFLAHAPLPAQTAPVPPVVEVPAGNEEYLRVAAQGTQNYVCLPAGWTFVGPQATLTLKIGKIRFPVGTHFLSPNPDESGTARATWQSATDTRTVWAKAIANSSDSAEPGAIPWLLLEVVGTETSRGRGSVISDTTYIQRVNTRGGMAPTTACAVGATAFVPYTAEYVFYQKASETREESRR